MVWESRVSVGVSYLQELAIRETMEPGGCLTPACVHRPLCEGLEMKGCKGW